MSNAPTPPVIPPDDSTNAEDVAVKEVDGDEMLDPDANDELIDSAAADRLATEPDAADPESPDD